MGDTIGRVCIEKCVGPLHHFSAIGAYNKNNHLYTVSILVKVTIIYIWKIVKAWFLNFPTLLLIHFLNVEAGHASFPHVNVGILAYTNLVVQHYILDNYHV